LTIFGGFLGFSVGKPPVFEDFLAEVDIEYHAAELYTGFHFTPEMWASVFAALLGIGVAVYLYMKFYDRLGPTWITVKKAFYIDDIYWNAIVLPIKAVANFIVDFSEPKIFDGFIRWCSSSTYTAAGWM